MNSRVNTASQAAGRIVRHLASLKLALVILVALGAGVMISYLSEVRTTWSLVVPLVLLSVNLMAAVATNAAFRRQKGLLLFHLALIAVVLLIATGRLTYLRGTLELTTGVMFEGALTTSEAGPLHSWRIRDVRFVNDGFEIDYAPGTPNQGFGTEFQELDGITGKLANIFGQPSRETIDSIGSIRRQKAEEVPSVSDTRGARRGGTRNRVHWLDKNKTWHTEVIGDNLPLVIQGYNFFTTSNKGYSPLFTWTPAGGAPITGAINLPSYPANEYKQFLEWTPPGSDLKLWTQLHFDEVIIDPFKPSQFRLPEQHKIVIRQNDSRHELKLGDSVKLPGGELTYQKLTTWMGYNVDSDWTISWLLAACGVAMASLTWHFWQKFAARPWQAEEEKAQ